MNFCSELGLENPPNIELEPEPEFEFFGSTTKTIAIIKNATKNQLISNKPIS